MAPSLTANVYEQAQNIWVMGSGNHEPITPPPEDLQDAYFANPPKDTVKPVTSDETPVVVVVGVGYVGLQLVIAFAQHFNVFAYDVSEKRLAEVDAKLASFPTVIPTTDTTCFTRATHFLISVPTLVTQDGSVEGKNISAALSTVSLHARPGSTIVIESSVAVGMTRMLLKEIVLSRGIKAGMSPERVDPGRTDPKFEGIPKIVSGLDDLAPGSLSSIMELYSKVFTTLVPVSCPEVAEMTKLYENCQRMMCIAYANEMADACLPLGIDPFEISRAAATKPFGYLPITPSLGVGGHCIPVNPYYLFASTPASSFPLLRQATKTMEARPSDIAERAMRTLCWRPGNALRFKKRKPRVLVVGVGFKRGQSVLCNSPGLSVIRHLQCEWDADIEFADPLVKQDAVPSVRRLDEMKRWNVAELSYFDMIFVAVQQNGLDFEILKDLPPRVMLENWSS